MFFVIFDQMLFIKCSIVFFILYVSDLERNCSEASSAELANQGTMSSMSCVIELSQFKSCKSRRTNSRCLLWRVAVGPRNLIGRYLTGC